MSVCPACARAEATRWQRLAGDLLDLIDRPHPVAQLGQAYSQAFRAALGISEQTWYDRHREAFVRTGDERELIRMQRHVSA